MTRHHPSGKAPKHQQKVERWEYAGKKRGQVNEAQEEEHKKKIGQQQTTSMMPSTISNQRRKKRGWGHDSKACRLHRWYHLFEGG